MSFRCREICTGARRLDSSSSSIFFLCIFTRLETITICSCNYFTFKTFSINPQSTLVYGLLYRQGRKRGVLVLVGSWDSPHLKLILHPLPLFQCWLSTHECLCKRSRPLPSFKIMLRLHRATFSLRPYYVLKKLRT